MTNDTSKLLSRFRLSESDLEADPAIKEAYRDYSDKRCAYGQAFRELNESITKLHDALDEPLRSADLVPDGKDWTFKDDDSDGLFIQVWSEPKPRGRRKEEVPLKHLTNTSNDELVNEAIKAQNGKSARPRREVIVTRSISKPAVTG